MKTLKMALLAICLCSIQACVSSDVISTGPDTYMVSASGAGFATAGVREKVYKKANDFCAKKGLVMVPVSFNARPGVLAVHPPSADLIFRALKPGDPAIARPDLVESNRSSVVTQSIRVTTKDESQKHRDIYGDLIKLDDLKKRGILSDAEFETAKQKLMQEQQN
jgi:hypothetical protein